MHDDDNDGPRRTACQDEDCATQSTRPVRRRGATRSRAYTAKFLRRITLNNSEVVPDHVDGQTVFRTRFNRNAAFKRRKKTRSVVTHYCIVEHWNRTLQRILNETNFAFHRSDAFVRTFVWQRRNAKRAKFNEPHCESKRLFSHEKIKKNVFTKKIYYTLSVHRVKLVAKKKKIILIA